MQLRVRVRDDLVLDAGTRVRVPGRDGNEWLIRPPDKTLFHQILEFLESKPDPMPGSSSTAGREGMAAAAVVLRWGSYLAVLLDRDKPVCSAAKRPHIISRISDGEMASINIEASAALAEWIEISRAPDARRRYDRLVRCAMRFLPMPKRCACRSRPRSGFGVLGVQGRANFDPRLRTTGQRVPTITS